MLKDLNSVYKEKKIRIEIKAMFTYIRKKIKNFSFVLKIISILR